MSNTTGVLGVVAPDGSLLSSAKVVVAVRRACWFAEHTLVRLIRKKSGQPRCRTAFRAGVNKLALASR